MFKTYVSHDCTNINPLRDIINNDQTPTGRNESRKFIKKKRENGEREREREREKEREIETEIETERRRER